MSGKRGVDGVDIKFNNFELSNFPFSTLIRISFLVTHFWHLMTHMENGGKGACALALALEIFETTRPPGQTSVYITMWQKARLTGIARAQLPLLLPQARISEGSVGSDPKQWAVKRSGSGNRSGGQHFHRHLSWKNPAVKLSN